MQSPTVHPRNSGDFEIEFDYNYLHYQIIGSSKSGVWEYNVGELDSNLLHRKIMLLENNLDEILLWVENLKQKDPHFIKVFSIADTMNCDVKVWKIIGVDRWNYPYIKLVYKSER